MKKQRETTRNHYCGEEGGDPNFGRGKGENLTFVCNGVIEMEQKVREFEAFFTRAGSKTIIATLSTDTPVEMMMGKEILVHTEQAIDFSRFPLPIVENHQSSSMPAIGRAKNPRLVGGQLKVDLHFGNSAKATETWQDIEDGIARHLSVGYVVIERNSPDKDGVYSVTRWQPLEASIVSVPADLGATIGRSANVNQLKTFFRDEGNDMKTRKDIENFFVEKNHENFKTNGDFLQAIASGARAGGREAAELYDPRLQETRVASGLSESVASDGGFLANSKLAEKILFGKHSSPLIRRCLSLRSNLLSHIKLPYPTSYDRSNGLFDGLVVYHPEEAETKTPTSPKLGMLDLMLRKSITVTYTSDELLADQPLLERWYARLTGAAIAFDLDRQLIRGNGANEWLGLMNSGAAITVAKEGGQAADTVISENVRNMVARLLPECHMSPSTVWIVNSEVLPFLWNLETPTSSSYVNLFQFTPEGQPNLLCGFPVIVSDHSSKVGDLMDICLTDLNYYLFCQKAIKNSISMHVNFLTDESCFRTVLRSAGQPIVSKPCVPANATGATVQSPIILLAPRA